MPAVRQKLDEEREVRRAQDDEEREMRQPQDDEEHKEWKSDKRYSGFNFT